MVEAPSITQAYPLSLSIMNNGKVFMAIPTTLTQETTSRLRTYITYIVSHFCTEKKLKKDPQLFLQIPFF